MVGEGRVIMSGKDLRRVHVIRQRWGSRSPSSQKVPRSIRKADSPLPSSPHIQKVSILKYSSNI